jgi:hypothetical protein
MIRAGRPLRETGVCGISRADSRDSVFAREDGRVRVVYQVAGQVRQLRDDLSRDISVSLCRDENANARRREQRRDELRSGRCAPGAPHDAWVGSHAQKLVDNRLGRVRGRARWRSSQSRQGV